MNLAAYRPHALSLLRIVAGFMFMQHGLQKMFGMLGGKVAPAYGLSWVAGILEGVGGALLMVGLFTRPVAFLLSGQMAVAYFRAHAPQGFWTIINRGELAALYSFVFLYFVVAGPGPWSLDRLIRRKT
jgi:putative oxidoreductase